MITILFLNACLGLLWLDEFEFLAIEIVKPREQHVLEFAQSFHLVQQQTLCHKTGVFQEACQNPHVVYTKEERKSFVMKTHKSS